MRGLWPLKDDMCFVRGCAGGCWGHTASGNDVSVGIYAWIGAIKAERDGRVIFHAEGTAYAMTWRYDRVGHFRGNEGSSVWLEHRVYERQ